MNQVTSSFDVLLRDLYFPPCIVLIDFSFISWNDCFNCSMSRSSVGILFLFLGVPVLGRD